MALYGVMTRMGKLTAPAIMRLVKELKMIPDHAEISRQGVAEWSDGDLSYVCWVATKGLGSPNLFLNTGDRKLGPSMKEYGGLSVWIRPSEERGFEWPAKATDEFIQLVSTEISGLVGFVADRRDLCTLLATPGSVTRGSHFAWLLPANRPARLVEALVLARDMDADELVESITHSLREDEQRLASAKKWAKDYSKALGYPIEV